MDRHPYHLCARALPHPRLVSVSARRFDIAVAVVICSVGQTPTLLRCQVHQVVFTHRQPDLHTITTTKAAFPNLMPPTQPTTPTNTDRQTDRQTATNKQQTQQPDNNNTQQPNKQPNSSCIDRPNNKRTNERTNESNFEGHSHTSLTRQTNKPTD